MSAHLGLGHGTRGNRRQDAMRWLGLMMEYGVAINLGNPGSTQNTNSQRSRTRIIFGHDDVVVALVVVLVAVSRSKDRREMFCVHVR